MATHRINKGLNLPITGAPVQTLHEATCSQVAIVAADYIEIRPRILVAEGDAVKRGQPLCEDRKIPGVVYTAPAAGTVKAINRGAKRALQSIVIELSDAEKSGSLGSDGFQSFASYKPGSDVATLSGDDVRALLVESGLWTALRQRPFSKVANPQGKASAVFVTAMDSNPLAPDSAVVMQGAGKDEAFAAGLAALAKLTDGKLFVCRAPGSTLGNNASGIANLQIEEFSGKHPAGTVGLHIHRLKPVHKGRCVWHVGYQDVAAIGRLFATGKLDVERVVSLAGPMVKAPRLLKTRLGASIDEMTQDGLQAGECRVITGSVLSGRAASGAIHGYLGRYHNQISVIGEERARDFLGWLTPGASRFSVLPVMLSKLMPGKKFAFGTSQQGSTRAMVPIGVYEKVMPHDLMPTFLLRAIAVDDIGRAEELGVLELDEEDLALCTFVCPGKTDWGVVLRRNLTTIEKEGLCSF